MTQAQEITEIAFKSGEIEFIEAVEQLQEQGYTPKDAEAIVSDWEEDMTLAKRREADRIDGYDKDDLGESPDF